MEEDIRAQLAAGRYREAFDLVLERFKDKVFRLSYAMLRSETQAEDMTQDVFIKVWKALPGYSGAASVSTWLYTITRNTCLTELKRRQSRPTISLDTPELEAVVDTLPAMQTTDPEGGAEMDVHELLGRLPEKYRQVVSLFYLDQKSYEEVGAMLGLPLGTVKTFLFRARKELIRLAARASRPATPPAVSPAGAAG